MKSIKQMADELGVSAGRIYKYIQRNNISEARRVGRLRLYDNAAVTKIKRFVSKYQPKRKTSSYLGIYYNAPNKCWTIDMEKHDKNPAFYNERDAAIYAEYHYRRLYDNAKPNFPELSDSDLELEYKLAIERLKAEQGIVRSYSKQGLKKSKESSSQYVGVFKQEGKRWVARIARNRKNFYITSFSINKYEDAEILAARAYDRKALELYDDEDEEDPRLNFPITDYRVIKAL